MSNFSVNITRTKHNINSLNSAKSRLGSMSNNHALGRNDAHVSGLKSYLNGVKSQLSDLSDEVGSLSGALEQITSAYSGTEKTLTSHQGSFAEIGLLAIGNWSSIWSKDKSKKTFELLKLAIGSSSFALGGAFLSDSLLPFGKDQVGLYLGKLSTEHAEEFLGKLVGEASSSLKSSTKFHDLNDDMKDSLRKKGLYDDAKEKWYKDKDGNIIDKKDAPTFYKRDATLMEAKGKIGASASIFEGKYNPSDGTELGVTVGKAEAHGEASAGLYVIDGNGNKKFSPGVKAEVGASVTALAVSWDQQWLGDENLGLSSDVDITVGKAEAKADATAQVFGEDGKLNVQVGASARAEAIAAEAKGSLDLNVMGGEVGVSGSVNFGVGAHADVGYRDGVFKFDVGASLGVGVSLGFEVDVGGMFNTVVSGAASAWEDFSNGWNSFLGGWGW